MAGGFSAKLCTCGIRLGTIGGGNPVVMIQEL